MRWLAFISLLYGVCLTCVAPVYFIVAIRFESATTILLALAMLLAGTCQWLYSSKTKLWLQNQPVSETDSLDAWELYNTNPEKLQKHSLLFQCFAGIAGFFQLSSVYFVVTNLSVLFYLSEFSNLQFVATLLFVTITFLLAIPALIFNLRTWNMTVISD
jgi:hypothetical protein